MCVREYKQNWEEIQKELQEQDVLKLTSLLELGENEEQLQEHLGFCKGKRIVLQVKESYLEADVYMEVLELIKGVEAKKKQAVYELQKKGIRKALEKKKEGTGSYGRPRVELPKDFSEQVKAYMKSNRPLEHYRKQTNLKKSTFYKYVHIVKKKFDMFSDV